MNENDEELDIYGPEIDRVVNWTIPSKDIDVCPQQYKNPQWQDTIKF